MFFFDSRKRLVSYLEQQREIIKSDQDYLEAMHKLLMSSEALIKEYEKSVELYKEAYEKMSAIAQNYEERWNALIRRINQYGLGKEAES